MDHDYCEIPPHHSQKTSTMCCVPFCSNRQGEIVENVKISMFNFPKKKVDSKRHNKWVRLLRIGKEVPKYAVVCSTHFKEDDYIPPSSKYSIRYFLNSKTHNLFTFLAGRNYPLLKRKINPSVNLPTLLGPPRIDIATDRSKRLARRQPKNEFVETNLVDSYQTNDSEFEDLSGTGAVEDEQVNSMNTDEYSFQPLTSVTIHTQTDAQQTTETSTQTIASEKKIDVGCQTESACFSTSFSQTDATHRQITDYSSQTKVSELKDVYTETENKYLLRPVTFIEMRSDEELKTWTGLRDLFLLQELTSLVMIIERRNRTRFEIDTKNRIIMTMIVLKHTMQYNMLATLYTVSDRCVSRYFTSTLLSLSEVLNSMIYWPSEEQNIHSMPFCFQMYTDTAIVLDCTECKCAKLSCVDCRISTYSHYKSGHTVKFLMGVTPAGTINYISRGYPGRASDKFIFNNENVIDLMDSKGAVMTDKGFSIENELAAKGKTKDFNNIALLLLFC
jgi:DDE superfamily endonuclease/THAP domain